MTIQADALLQGMSLTTGQLEPGVTSHPVSLLRTP